MFQSRVEEEAKRLYYNHMELDEIQHYFMWDQCSEEYRNAWRLIARVHIEE